MNHIAAAHDGPIYAIVNCWQFNDGSVPSRFGSRAVRASSESVAGLTEDAVHFVGCDVCHAVSMQIGTKGDQISDPIRIVPRDARAQLLCQIIEEREWSRPMHSRARVLGIVNVHGAAKMSEVGCVCFNCGAGPL